MEFIVHNAEDVDGQKEKVIKYEDVSSLVEEDIATYEGVYVKGVTDLLEEEMSGGGLDPYALCIEGETPAYDKAQKLNTKSQSLKADISSLKSKVEADCYKQRAKELKQLSAAIQVAIEEHQAKKTDYESKDKALKAEWQKVRGAEANCQNAGMQYSTKINYFGGYSYEEVSALTLNGTNVKAIIGMPQLPENTWEDDIQKETEQIEKLNAKKQEVDAEATSASGKAG